MERKENPVFKRSEESYAKNRIFMQEYNKTPAKKEADRRYAENNVLVKVSLNRNTDADIIQALDPSKPLAPQLKALIRLALRARDMFQ